MTTTVTLGAELDRLDQRLDELTEQIEDADAGSEGAAMLTREARDVDQAGAAVSDLVETYSEDAEVVVRPLTAGDYARVEDRVDDMRAVKSGPGGVPGSSRNVFAAAGLVEAPFLNGVEPDDLDGKISAVAGQQPGVAKWLESLVSDHTGSDGKNWTPLSERLAGTNGT